MNLNFSGAAVRSLIWLSLFAACCAEKLSPNQQAPLFARGSGGLILKAPFEGEQGKIQPSSNAVDQVERDETEMLKEVDGQLVRVVEGHFAYNSPEGLPIYVKYTADENGNKASFKFGTGQSGGSRPNGPHPGGPDAGGTGPGSPGRRGQGQGSKPSAYLPPKDVDRSYLPPQ